MDHYSKKRILTLNLEKMKKKKNELCEKDRNLFSQMESCYQSDEEREFFERMKEKEECDNESEQDIIMSSYANDERLLIYRNFYDWFMVMRVGIDDDVHEFDCLADMLSAPLSEWGLGEGSVLDWFRRRNYAGVRYDDHH